MTCDGDDNDSDGDDADDGEDVNHGDETGKETRSQGQEALGQNDKEELGGHRKQKAYKGNSTRKTKA